MERGGPLAEPSAAECNRSKLAATLPLSMTSGKENLERNRSTAPFSAPSVGWFAVAFLSPEMRTTYPSAVTSTSSISTPGSTTRQSSLHCLRQRPRRRPWKLGQSAGGFVGLEHVVEQTVQSRLENMISLSESPFVGIGPPFQRRPRGHTFPERMNVRVKKGRCPRGANRTGTGLLRISHLRTRRRSRRRLSCRRRSRSPASAPAVRRGLHRPVPGCPGLGSELGSRAFRPFCVLPSEAVNGLPDGVQVARILRLLEGFGASRTDFSSSADSLRHFRRAAFPCCRRAGRPGSWLRSPPCGVGPPACVFGVLDHLVDLVLGQARMP